VAWGTGKIKVKKLGKNWHKIRSGQNMNSPKAVRRGKGKGWHGDSAGHSLAARKSGKGRKITYKKGAGKKRAFKELEKRSQSGSVGMMKKMRILKGISGSKSKVSTILSKRYK